MQHPNRSLVRFAALAVFLAAVFPCLAGRIRVGNLADLQPIIDAAQPGDVISLPIMFLSGGVVLDGKSDIEIRAGSALIKPKFFGEHIGIHIRNSSNITLKGFHVRDFEQGIVIEDSTSCTVTGMTVESNYDKTGGPGLDADGIVLINSTQNDISRNYIFGSGNNGIRLTGASSDNTVSRNTIHDNGFQTLFTSFSGSGIALEGGPTNNAIDNNTISNNSHWGIYVDASSGNQITRNKVTGNGWAGIAVFGSSADNLLGSNTVAGNNTNTTDPSPVEQFDIYDASTGAGNTYSRNKGDMGGPGLP